MGSEKENNHKNEQRINESSRQYVDRTNFNNEGDVHIGPKIIQKIDDKSVTYDVDLQNTTNIERLSMSITNKFGEKKSVISGTIAVIAGIFTIIEGIKSLMPTNVFLAGFNWLPILPQNTAQYVLAIGIMLLAGGTFLISLVEYKHNSRCPSCGAFYRREEIGEPMAKDVEVNGGRRRTITRTYRCKQCNHTYSKKYNSFIADEPEIS